jgi:hypothetical protein
MTEYILPAPKQTQHHSIVAYNNVDGALFQALEMGTIQGLNIQNMDYAGSQCYDEGSPYMPMSEISLRSTQAYDTVDSSSHTCRSDSGSVYDSPLPGSPMLNGLHPNFQSPSSTGSYPSPNHHHLSPSSAATAVFYPSPSLDVDRDTPSPRTSSDDRRTKSS